MVDLASRLNHRITFLRREISRSPSGAAVETWAEDGTAYASVETLRAGEYFSQAAIPQTEARVEARIRIRFRPGLNPADLRIKHGPTVYDVLGVIHDGKNYETQLMVKANAREQGPGQAVNP